MILLDTHVMIWHLAGDRRMGRRAARRVDRAAREAELVISAFSFWELGLLVAAGRLRMRLSPAEFRVASLRAGIAEIPVDGKIAILSTELAGMHADPADRIIVATALETNATLMTADAQILGMRTGPERQDAQV